MSYNSVKCYLKTTGNTVNHVFAIPQDFTAYSCTVIQVSGDVVLEKLGKTRSKQQQPGYSPLYLCCDICEHSFLGGLDSEIPLKLPILLELPPLEGFVGNRDLFMNRLLWVGVNNNRVNDIRLYIVDEFGNIPSFETCKLRCTLLFTKTVHK